MKKIAFAGSFDPITNGHLWLIKEGLNIADKMLLMVAINPDKKYFLDKNEKLELIQKTLKAENIEDKVEVKFTSKEYITHLAKNEGCQYLLRGLRDIKDFSYEQPMQEINYEVLDGLKTLFVCPPSVLNNISSSFVKSLMDHLGWQWYLKNTVPTAVYQHMIKNYIFRMIKKYSIDNHPDIEINTMVDKILQKYEGRAYHNIEHIVHCLTEFDWYINNAEPDLHKFNRHNVFWAIIFHDIEYKVKDVKYSDEELSAKWIYNNITISNIRSIQELIEATQHLKTTDKVKTKEEEILISIDLAILGQSQKIYNQYASNIRKEYAEYSWEEYRKGRINVLNKLISIDLYKYEFNKYEYAAKINLQNELDILINNEQDYRD